MAGGHLRRAGPRQPRGNRLQEQAGIFPHSLPPILQEDMGWKGPGCSQPFLLSAFHSARKAPEPEASWCQLPYYKSPETMRVSISFLLGRNLGSFRAILIKAVFFVSVF